MKKMISRLGNRWFSPIAFRKELNNPNFELRSPEILIPGNVLSSVPKGMVSSMQEFYGRLFLEHPNISRNEKAICGLLKLNFNTTQIAEIIDSKPHSIEVARTRLRKKLGLTNTGISLYQYLDLL